MMLSMSAPFGVEARCERASISSGKSTLWASVRVDPKGKALEAARVPLAVALVIGTAVSLVQAVTSVQEATLTFVPKLAGVAIVMILAGGWMLDQLVTYTRTLFQSIPGLVG